MTIRPYRLGIIKKQAELPVIVYYIDSSLQLLSHDLNGGRENYPRKTP